MVSLDWKSFTDMVLYTFRSTWTEMVLVDWRSFTDIVTINISFHRDITTSCRLEAV